MTVVTSARKRPSDRTGLAIIAGGLAAFLLLTSLVESGILTNFDTALLRAFRNPTDPALPLGPHWLERAMTDITTLGGTVVLTLTTLFAFIVLLILHQRKSACLLLCTIFGGFLVNRALKAIIARPRPDVVPHLVEISSLSFPSGHAMMAMIAWLTIGTLLAQQTASAVLKRYIFVFAVFLSVLIGVSRLYLGVHWPSDIVAGWTLGGTWVVAMWLVARRFSRN